MKTDCCCTDPVHDVFLSLVVPVYNESRRLTRPIEEVDRFLQGFVTRYEILYVDDGSTDATAEALEEAASAHPHLRVLRHPTNRGKGSAIRTGFEEAAGDVLMFSDADFSTPVSDAAALLEKIAEGYEFVFGSRALPSSLVEVHQSWMREMMGKTFNMLVRAFLPLDFPDTQCGFKMLTRRAASIIVPRMTIERFAFDVEMLAIAWMHSIPMAEVPVTWRNVQESKVHPVRDSARMIRDLLAIRYRLALGLYS